MLRYRMNKLIKALENDDADSLKSLLTSVSYLKALKALEDIGCIKVIRAWGGDIAHVQLNNHYVTYQLERQEVWKNRIYGFLFGVATSVLTALITGILPI